MNTTPILTWVGGVILIGIFRITDSIGGDWLLLLLLLLLLFLIFFFFLNIKACLFSKIGITKYFKICKSDF